MTEDWDSEQWSLAYMDELPTPMTLPDLEPRPKARKHQREKSGYVRKAYASKGDDCTFSRWVKIKRPPGSTPPRKPKQIWFPDMKHKVLVQGRSLFHKKGVHAVNSTTVPFVSGHCNVKIGRDVRHGKLFRGYWIYTLTLEERKTCPRTCHHWQTCYGNHMPWAKRYQEGHALERAIERSLPRLLGIHGRKGVLIRLHALGDFYSIKYVALWDAMLAIHPNLAVYGYTARRPGTDIGDAIAAVKARWGPRFAVRWSDGGVDEDCTVSILHESDKPRDAFVCPEQTGKVDGCGKCGLCWETTKNVAFVEH